MEELTDAKLRGFGKLIVGDTGCGKTYTMRQFKAVQPLHTYCVTVSSLHGLKDILYDICAEMGMNKNGKPISLLKRIAGRMQDIRLSGGFPVIMLDESENLKLHQLKMTKGLYDALEEYCPIVMLGTYQLLRKIEQLREKDEEGIPQLYRRFKAGIREVRGIDKQTAFTSFLTGVADEDVRRIVMSLADNYGELNRYLEPALRESEAMKVPLDEKFYRMLYKI
jgi:DNA transposition AAA+ family ATPase